MRKLPNVLVLLTISLFLVQPAFANNVAVSNIGLTGQSTADKFTLVQFDLTWENSWRDPVNWDAAWIFVKFSTDGGSTWMHATLDTTGHTAPAGSTIDTPGDGRGVFIYRDASGSGTVSFNGVQLRWNYGTDGVADDAVVQLKVFAIEMVLVPEAAFAAAAAVPGLTNSL